MIARRKKPYLLKQKIFTSVIYIYPNADDRKHFLLIANILCCVEIYGCQVFFIQSIFSYATQDKNSHFLKRYGSITTALYRCDEAQQISLKNELPQLKKIKCKCLLSPMKLSLFS